MNKRMKNHFQTGTSRSSLIICSFFVCIFFSCILTCISACGRSDNAGSPVATEEKTGQAASPSFSETLPEAEGAASPSLSKTLPEAEGAVSPFLSKTLPEAEGAASLSASISENYDIDILYGNKVPQTYKDYTAEREDDPGLISDALAVISRTLALYPPDYFHAVKEGYCDSISLCLAGELHLISDGSCMENADAFTTVQDGTIWLVLNIKKGIRPGLLIHELTHAADYRLLEMQQLLENEWNHLNPPSFSYYNAYLDEDGKEYRTTGSREYTSLYEEDPERIYFYDPYSRTFAMEDRARLMEKLLENIADPAGPPPDAFSHDNYSPGAYSPDTCSTDTYPPDRCFLSPHVQTKLRFYFYTLRQAFQNEGWPEKTVWEAALLQAKQ